MRNQFAETMTELVQENPKLVLLTGDTGNRLFNDYKAYASDRFFNCGIAEANMITMAAGLAHAGYRPVAYTITPFITTRCLEQIKVDVCYHEQPVIIVGTGSGLSYAALGATHHSCEDIAIMRALPNMQVICAADKTEVRLALRAALAQEKPTYIRIGKKNEPPVHHTDPHFKIGKAIPLTQGDDICLLATGNIVPEAQNAAKILAAQGISTATYSFHTVKPLDTTLLKQLTQKFNTIVTIEEHNKVGGFGSAIAEWITDHGQHRCTVLRLSTPDAFIHYAENQQSARQACGLTGETIAERILNHIPALQTSTESI